MIRMVISSFHNTLINDEGAILVPTMLEIERIRKKGILFSVFTNKDYREVLDYNKDFPFLDYIISLKGAYIYDVKERKEISKTPLEKEEIDEIIKKYKRNKKNYYLAEKVEDNIDNINEPIYKIEVMKGKSVLEFINSKYDSFQMTQKLLKEEKIKKNEILFIGANDYDNDMIKNIRNHYILNNSSKGLKMLTERIIGNNNENSIQEVLKKL